MASFTPSQHNADEYNNGIKYVSGDALQAETVNNLVESALYTQQVADSALAHTRNELYTCATTESNQYKVVTAPDFTSDNLVVGARITVNFTYKNSAISPYLNVNNTGAKRISADGDTTYVKWIAGVVMEFVYDGTYWVCVCGYPLAGMRAGFVYISDNSTSPATLYGGSWSPIYDRFIVGAGNLYTNGATGGSKDAVVVEHTHTGIYDVSNNQYVVDSGGGATGYRVSFGSNKVQDYGAIITGSTGASGTNKNMPPYRAEYIWYRTA